MPTIIPPWAFSSSTEGMAADRARTVPTTRYCSTTLYRCDYCMGSWVVLQSTISSAWGAMAKARASTMHSGALPTKGTKSHGLGKGLLWARSTCIAPVLAWHSAGVHLARRSYVPEYRYPCKYPATSDSPRLWWSKGAYGVSPSNTTIARMDPYGFGPRWNSFFFAARCLRATKVAGGALQSAEWVKRRTS